MKTWISGWADSNADDASGMKAGEADPEADGADNLSRTEDNVPGTGWGDADDEYEPL